MECSLRNMLQEAWGMLFFLATASRDREGKRHSLAAMSRQVFPFGDGHASERIVKVMLAA